MRKLLVLLSLAIFISANLSAQVSVSVNVPSAGGLSAAIKTAGGNKTTITNLTITGNIDARDFKFMRDSMSVIAAIDTKTVIIKAYSGTEGTSDSPVSTSYPANAIPYMAFCINGYINGAYGKPTLKSFVFPDYLIAIESNAFKYTGLSGNLEIPNSITSIGGFAFSSCIGLTGSLTLPKSLTTLGVAAFIDCNFSGQLIIPNSVTIIDHTFAGCDNFTGNLVLSNNLVTIDNESFNNCSRLTGDLIIPSSVRNINWRTFGWCSGFSACYIPNSITSIGSDAFFDCSGLQKIAVNKVTPITIDTTTFSGVSKINCELIVPIGSKTAYQAATGWKLFTNITEAIFVSLNTQGGNPAFPITTSISNSTISEPIIPIREGYTFAGWYKEAACNNAWNFATDIVTAPITLYAKWGIATGVENLPPTNFKIYPNPATSMLYVENLTQGDEINIFSMDGKFVKQQKSPGSNGNVDISNLPKGVYMLKINSKVGKVAQKFIKQ